MLSCGATADHSVNAHRLDFDAHLASAGGRRLRDFGVLRCLTPLIDLCVMHDRSRLWCYNSCNVQVEGTKRRVDCYPVSTSGKE